MHFVATTRERAHRPTGLGQAEGAEVDSLDMRSGGRDNLVREDGLEVVNSLDSAFAPIAATGNSDLGDMLAVSSLEAAVDRKPEQDNLDSLVGGRILALGTLKAAGVLADTQVAVVDIDADTGYCQMDLAVALVHDSLEEEDTLL